MIAKWSICAIAALCLVTLSAASTSIRGCYLTNWAQYRPGAGKWNTTADYQTGICTHIFYAFAYVNASSFSAYPSDPSDSGSNGGYAQLKQIKSKDSSLKTILSFGGASFDSSIFTSAASSSSNAQKFAQNVVEFAKSNGFDGVDIDWEYPTQSSQFTTLMSAVKSAAGSDMLVTAATSAGISQIQESYDLSSLSDSVDFLNVMTYDYHGSWNDETGNLSPLNSSDTLNVMATINAYISGGFPASQLLLGVPTYGTGWTLSSSSANQGINSPTSGASTSQSITQTAGTAAYYELCQMTSATDSFDSTAEEPYLQSGNQWFSYENPKSIGYLAKYAEQKGMAGMFVWTLDFDDFSGSCPNGQKYPLLSAIKSSLSPSSSSQSQTEVSTNNSASKNSSQNSQSSHIQIPSASQNSQSSTVQPSVSQPTNPPNGGWQWTPYGWKWVWLQN